MAGNFFGLCAYYLLENFRKRALSNLALASDLHLSNEQIVKTAKESFQNLMITCLEYPKFYREKNIKNAVTCVNPGKALDLLNQKKGVIFFCGHQANWEILFLEGTSRMPGVAIGKPTKNKYLYDWVLSIRQKFNGIIVPPKNAIKEGLRALKQHKFLGIVGDQGMPDSGFSSLFLGRLAYTSPMPAILSYRTQSPIIVATTLRKNGRYVITYSDPIWPNTELPMEEEMPRLMKESLLILEKSIKENPGQWLWQHNRWKRQLPGGVIKKYRHDSLCVVFPEKLEQLLQFKEIPGIIRKFYPSEHILFMIPKHHKNLINLSTETYLEYDTFKDCFVDDYKIKLLINLTEDKYIESHFKKRAVLQVLNLRKIITSTNLSQNTNIDQLLEKVLLHAK